MEKWNGEVYQRRGLWWIKYRHDGKEFRQSVARILRMPKQAVTAKHAKQALEETLRSLYQDRFVDPRHSKLTLGDCLDQLVVTMGLKGNKSLVEETALIGRIKAQVGHYHAPDVQTHVVAKWAREWMKAHAAATVDKWCGYVVGALRLAVKQERLSKAPERPEIGIDNARQGFVTPEEAEAIVATLRVPPVRKPNENAAYLRDRDTYADAVDWAFRTAWRRGEILSLRWEYVDRAAGQITLPETKNHDRRVLPIVGSVAEILERRWRVRALGCPWVFHRAGRQLAQGRLVKNFKTAAIAAGLPAATIFHDLRRSAVREMELGGVPRSVAMKISGHRSETVYKRYAITNTEDVANALRTLDARRGLSANADKRRTIPGGGGGHRQ